METEKQIDSLSRTLVATLTRNRLSLATAESCTGGLIAGALTSIPGSSSAYLGGFVTYSNQSKQELLGVPHNTLETDGAVSELCACEMAAGARQKLHADFSVSVTGIAGPDGGTVEKPVGTVWIGVAGPDGVWAQAHHFPGDRNEVRTATVCAALQAISRAVASG